MACVGLSTGAMFTVINCSPKHILFISGFLFFVASPPPAPEPLQGFCPDGWELKDSSCYLFDSDLGTASWSDAVADCQSRYSSDLVSIHSNSEEEFVRSRSASAFGEGVVWLGMDRNMGKNPLLLYLYEVLSLLPCHV